MTTMMTKTMTKTPLALALAALFTTVPVFADAREHWAEAGVTLAITRE